MLKVELKRILKKRSTWWLVSIALGLSLFFALYTIRSEVYYQHENGQTTIIRGTQAYQLKKNRYSVISGEITSELLSQAVKVYHEVINEYGDDYSVPDKINDTVLGPYSPVYTWITQAFTDKNGIHYTVADISSEQAKGYYKERILTLKKELEKKYKTTPRIVEYAMAHVDTNEGNFFYEYGIGSTNTYQNFSMLVFLVTLICMIIVVPLFSADYASGADDIIRCTKKGRRCLAVAKLFAAFILSISIFVLCCGIFILIMCGAFGVNDQTAVELLNIMYNPLSLTSTEVLGMIVLSGFLTLVSMCSFTLFISSRNKSPTVVLVIVIAVSIFPTIIRMFGAGGSLGSEGISIAEGNIINWIRFCIPSGGLTMVGSMLDELVSLHFLWIGKFVIWSPYILLISAIVQIPVWSGIAVLSYCRHECQ